MSCSSPSRVILPQHVAPFIILRLPGRSSIPAYQRQRQAPVVAVVQVDLRRGTYSGSVCRCIPVGIPFPPAACRLLQLRQFFFDSEQLREIGLHETVGFQSLPVKDIYILLRTYKLHLSR